MSQHDDFDRSLARWFEEESQPAATADVLDRALRATRRHRPRPPLYAALGSHWVGDCTGQTAGGATLLKTGLRASMALLVLVLVLALVAGAVLVGARLLQPPPAVGHVGHLGYTLHDGLYVADWDGRSSRRIVSPSQLPDIVPDGCREFFGGPTWSPDGRHLAIRTVWSDRCEGFVIITDAEGASVATVPGAGWRVAWSPDSGRIVTWIAFLDTIAVYGIDGERQVLLDAPASSGDHDPGWTPDGSAVQLLGTVMPLEGSAPYVDRSLYRPRAEISPDGKWLASAAGSSVVVSATDGSSERSLGSLRLANVVELVWAPASDRIAFRTDRSGLGTVDVATGATTLVDGLPGEFSLVGFAPDGDRFLLATDESVPSDGRSALWLVESGGATPRKLVDGTRDGDWQWLPPGSEPSEQVAQPSATVSALPSVGPASASPTVAASPSVEPTSVPSLELDAHTDQLLNAFVQARVDGSGAGNWLLDPREEVPLLYATSSGASFDWGEFEQVVDTEWPYHWAAFKVRLHAGDTVVEQLFFTSLSGPRKMVYQVDGFRTDIPPTTEDGQALGVPATYFDGEVTMELVHPWVSGKLIPEGAGPTTDGGERNDWVRLIVKADPATCQPGRPADADALAETIRSDPNFQATPPVAVSAGGANALVMDVVATTGVGACGGISLAAGERMRLFLIDAPEASSMRVLAIAIAVPEAGFARAVAPAASMVDSIEFHAP